MPRQSLHRRLLVSIFANNNRLAVYLEVLVTPRRECFEKVLEIKPGFRCRGIDQELSFPGVGSGSAVRLQHEDTDMISHHNFIALTMRRQPDSGFETYGFDVCRKSIHAARESLIDRGPIAVLAEPVPDSLPSIIQLHIPCAVIL